MKKILIAAGVTLALAAPAFADTLQEVTTKGVVMSVQGMDIPIVYKPDGTFSVDFQGQSITGRWRIDGTTFRSGLYREATFHKLCTTSTMSPEERCTEYPTGKHSGDSFEITGAMGPVTIKIN